MLLRPGWASVVDEIEKREEQDQHPWWYNFVGAEDTSAWLTRLYKWVEAVSDWGPPPSAQDLQEYEDSLP